MTRIDSVRHAAGTTKDSVRHAAEVAAPYASTARESAVRYAHQAGTYGRQAGGRARQQYGARFAPRVGQARDQAWAALPPKATTAMESAARRARTGTKAAADYTVPRVGTAVTVTRSVVGPAREEAALRGAAALHALRGQVTAEDIDRLVRRRIRREKTGRAFRGLVVLGLAGSAMVAAWKWWSKQTSPDWLVEPSEPTEDGDRTSPGGTLTVVDPLGDSGASASANGSTPRAGRVDGSPGASGLDPEVEAKQAEADRRRKKDEQ